MREQFDAGRFRSVVGNTAAMVGVPAAGGLAAYAAYRILKNRRRDPSLTVPEDQLTFKQSSFHGAALNDPKTMGALTLMGIGGVGLGALGKRMVTSATPPNADAEMAAAREEYRKALRRRLTTPAQPGFKIASDPSEDPFEVCMQVCDAGFESFEKQALPNPFALAAIAAPLIATAAGIHGYQTGSERNMKLIRERAAEDARRRYRISKPPVVKMLTPGHGWGERDLLSLSDENNLIVPLDLDGRNSSNRKSASDASTYTTTDPDVAAWLEKEKAASGPEELYYVELTPDQIAGVFAGSLLQHGCVLPENEKIASEIEKLADASVTYFSPEELIEALNNPQVGPAIASKIVERSRTDPQVQSLFKTDLRQLDPQKAADMATAARELSGVISSSDLPGMTDNLARFGMGMPKAGPGISGLLSKWKGSQAVSVAQDPRNTITRMINEGMGEQGNMLRLMMGKGPASPTSTNQTAAGGGASGGAADAGAAGGAANNAGGGAAAAGGGGIMDYLKGTDPLQLLMMLGGGMGLANGNTIPGLLALGLGLGGPEILKQLVGSGVLPKGMEGGLQKYLDWHGNNSIGSMFGGGQQAPAPAADPGLASKTQPTEVAPVGQNNPAPAPAAPVTPAAPAVDPKPMGTPTSAIETERGSIMTTQPNQAAAKLNTPVGGHP